MINQIITIWWVEFKSRWGLCRRTKDWVYICNIYKCRRSLVILKWRESAKFKNKKCWIFQGRYLQRTCYRIDLSRAVHASRPTYYVIRGCGGDAIHGAIRRRWTIRTEIGRDSTLSYRLLAPVRQQHGLYQLTDALEAPWGASQQCEVDTVNFVSTVSTFTVSLGNVHLKFHVPCKHGGAARPSVLYTEWSRRYYTMAQVGRLKNKA